MPIAKNDTVDPSIAMSNDDAYELVLHIVEWWGKATVVCIDVEKGQ